MPEAPLEDSGSGLVPAGDGWFVVNVRDAEWWTTENGESQPSGSACIFESETSRFRQLGFNVQVLAPGESNGLYHSESPQEAFLVLSGECMLLVEGAERLLRPWDFFHCPGGTEHIFVGAGDGPCVILAVSSRQFQKDGPWGFYCADETARRYNASSPEDTQDSDVAYARFPPSQPTRYSDGLLPD